MALFGIQFKKSISLLIMTAISATILSAASTQACSIDGKEGFLPENDLRIEVGQVHTLGIDEKMFNQVIDRVEKLYTPIIAAAGGKLVVERLWSDATVNAQATRSGNTWKVTMFGGLARHPAITPDGMALVVCHELGHHLGGAPRVSSFFGTSWAANEGQADYFASLKCLRKAFAHDQNEHNSDTPAIVTEKCQKSYNKADDIRICERASMAGMSVSKLFASLKALNVSTMPQFETPDTTQVRKTFDGHPQAQCRLDTYFQGAICDKPVDGALSQTDPTVGTCSMEKGDVLGVRPLCWFKPKTSRFLSRM